VDFDMPVMNNLELGISTGNSNLFRNNSGASYPYSIGNLASITGHNSPWGDPEYHYFFYNLQLQENCLSEFGEATAVFMLPSSIVDESFNISVFPNPTQGTIFVSAKDRIKEIQLYDISGRLCLKQSTSNSLVEIDCSALTNGMYIIKIITEKHTSSQHLIIR
jgi:hypothetical protein